MIFLTWETSYLDTLEAHLYFQSKLLHRNNPSNSFYCHSQCCEVEAHSRVACPSFATIFSNCHAQPIRSPFLDKLYEKPAFQTNLRTLFHLCIEVTLAPSLQLLLHLHCYLLIKNGEIRDDACLWSLLQTKSFSLRSNDTTCNKSRYGKIISWCLT